MKLFMPNTRLLTGPLECLTPHLGNTTRPASIHAHQSSPFNESEDQQDEGVVGTSMLKY